MSEQRQAARLERLIRRLLEGRRLKLGSGDAADRDAIMAAARLAGAREAYPRLSPSFRRRLAAQLSEAASEPRVTRRSALVAGLGIALGGVVGVAADRVSNRAFPGLALKVPAERVEINPVQGRWTDAGAVAQLPEGQAVRVVAGSVIAYLFRHGDTVRAVSGICSHLPCTLDWHSDVGSLVCPCHNQAFDSEGHSMAQYPLPSLNVVKVQVVDGRVQVLGT